MLGKLFVNKTQLAVFVLYISIWVLHGQLVTWSKSTGMAPYSASLTVLFAELGKCLVCLVVYRRVHFVNCTNRCFHVLYSKELNAFQSRSGTGVTF